MNRTKSLADRKQEADVSSRRNAFQRISGNKKAGSEKTRLSLLEVPIKAKPPEGNTPRR